MSSQPKLDCDKGRPVRRLLTVLRLDSDDILPIYAGDDTPNEVGFEALAGRRLRVFVGDPDDPDVANRTTAADFRLDSIEESSSFSTRSPDDRDDLEGDSVARLHARVRSV